MTSTPITEPPLSTRPAVTSDAKLVEAWALNEVATRLEAVRHQSPVDPAALLELVRLNWRLWTIFQTSVASPDCPLPTALRDNLVALTNFVDHSSADIINHPDPARLEPLIQLNRQIARGLVPALPESTDASPPPTTDSRPLPATTQAPPVTTPEAAIDRATLAQLSALAQAERKDDLIAESEGLLSLLPNHPPALYGLALLALLLGDFASARDALSQAHADAPHEPLYPEALAILSAQAGQLADATYYAKLSTALGFDQQTQALLPDNLPTFAQAMAAIREKPLLARAKLYQMNGERAEAQRYFRNHLAFFPDDPAAVPGYAASLLDSGKAAEAIELLSRAAEARPLPAGQLSLLAQAQAALGDAVAARTSHREAVAQEPDNAALRYAWLADAILAPGQTGETLAALEQAQLPAPPAAALVAAGTPGTGAGAPLKVGFLLAQAWSAEDRAQVARLIRRLPAVDFELYGYGAGLLSAPVNTVFQGDFANWRDSRELDPATLAAIIAGDDIDLLIDIGGYATAYHQETLSYHGARRQLSWLGNPGLGLGAGIDLVLVDSPEAAAGATGRFWPLAHGRYGFDPAVTPLRPPPGQRPQLTFGADLPLAALHPELLAAWAAILHQLPKARLALRDRNQTAPAVINRLVTLFQDAGIADRVDLIDAEPAAFYSDIDLALAPFAALHPYETAQALSQGVPVVAWRGSAGHQRQAASLLHHAGLDRLVAGDVAGYVALALQLGQDPAARVEAEAAVARAVLNAPVFDPVGFAASFGAALQAIAAGQEG